MNLRSYILCIAIACCSLFSVFGHAQQVKSTQSGPHEFAWMDERLAPRAIDWADKQTNETIALFTTRPMYEELLADAEAVLTREARYPRLSYHNDQVFEYYQDANSPLGVWRRSSRQNFYDGEPKWQTLIDLDALSAKESRKWLFAGAQCLENRCLISLSDNGKDAHEIREFDLGQNQFVEDGFSIPEDKSAVWWVDANTLIVSSNLFGGKANENGYPATLRLWQRGTLLSAAKTLFEAEVSDAFVGAAFIGANNGNGFLINRAVNYYETETYYVDFGGNRHKLPLPKQYQISGVREGQLLLTLGEDFQPTADAMFEAGSLVSIDLSRLFENGEIYNPQLLYKPSDMEAVRSVMTLQGRLYVELLRNYHSVVIELSRVDEAWSARDLPLPSNGFISFAGSWENQLLLKIQAPLAPASLVLFEPNTAKTRTLYKASEAFNSSDLEIKLLHTRSKDGTEISYTVMHKKGVKKNGKNPTLIYGYGGFNVSITPRYEPVFGRLWLERGGVYVHAYIRGGGERGPKWHQSALRENRQLAYDDMIAVIEDLQVRKITSPPHTGIMGRSNGGLMVANVMVQRPDLMNAVVIGGPLLDMLAYQLLPPGASWTAEYGDPRDGSSVTDYLVNFSPLHQLRPGTTYPAPLLITSLDDDRVLPGHARRFKARMDALEQPSFYFEDKQGGHYWELAGGPAPGDWRLRSKARAIEFTYLWQRLAP